MKKLTLVFTVLAICFHVSADVFITSSNSIDLLSVGTNQSLLISSVKIGGFDQYVDDPGDVLALVVQNGVTNTIEFADVRSSGSYAITGACQIAFVQERFNTNTTRAVVVTYQLVQNVALHSAILTPGEIRKMTYEMFEAEREFLPGYR